MSIKLFVMDVDGTMTDGQIYMGQNGEAMKAFHVRDGYGIAHLLPENGIVPVIITGRESRIVANRASELGIQCLYQGAKDKNAVLHKVMENYNVTPEETAYIGDDRNDLDCIQAAGLTACPSDAAEEVQATVDYICVREGGKGAVREFIDLILREGK